MSESANVRAINSLDELRSALMQFRAQAQESLQAAAQEIGHTFEWLAEHKQHWHNEVRRREEIVRAAKAALARCEASDYRDEDGHYHQPDCSSQQYALVQAQVRLREAEAELQAVKGWTNLVQGAADEYQQKARQLNECLTNGVSKATALLGASADTLRSYTTMGVALMGLANTTGAAISSTNLQPATNEELVSSATSEPNTDESGDVPAQSITNTSAPSGSSDHPSAQPVTLTHEHRGIT